MKRIVLGCLFTLGLVAAGSSPASAQGISFRYGVGGYSSGSGHVHGGHLYGPGYGRVRIRPSHSHWHDTTHRDYHPGSYQRHFDHFDYVPSHYDLHRSGHWDTH